MSEKENNFKIGENTPHLHVDGVAGYINLNKAKIYLFRTDADPELKNNGEMEFEHKQKVLAVLEMSPVAVKRATAWLNELVEGFEERNQKELEEEATPGKMFG